MRAPVRAHARPARRAVADHGGRQIAKDGAARATTASRPTVTPGRRTRRWRPRRRPRCAPRARAAEVGLVRVMVGGAQVAALRHHGVRTDVHRPQAVDHGIVADPGMLADVDFPGIGHGGAGPDQRLGADARAEQPQQPAPESRRTAATSGTGNPGPATRAAPSAPSAGRAPANWSSRCSVQGGSPTRGQTCAASVASATSASRVGPAWNRRAGIISPLPPPPCRRHPRRRPVAPCGFPRS